MVKVKVTYYVGFGWYGWWFHWWTPVWHEGRGPYITVGFGVGTFQRGY